MFLLELELKLMFYYVSKLSSILFCLIIAYDFVMPLDQIIVVK
jgi:hypothetical protein